ncbi:MAG: amino acid ABC transporter permease [Anaerostipes sp.]|jgi:polar amino acid transport system permease protein|nr:amino acid ABC transporter permease [Anaerostipes sp.]MDD3747366.1 amino acid ABC transporter permease [Anaerostipes sp.]
MEVLNSLDFATAWAGLYPTLLEGFGVVIQATIMGFILALILGILVAIGRISKFKVLNGVLVFIIEIIRGTPLLVQLVYMYYVVPLLLTITASFFGFEQQIQIDALTAGIVGLGVNYGAYLSEVFRSAIISIDVGQTEAALALGFTGKQTLLRIIMPQAFKNAVPTLGNYLVMMVKDTSLLAYITVAELLLRTKAYTSQTFLTIESYTILAGAYLVISVPLSQLVRIIERKMKR